MSTSGKVSVVQFRDLCSDSLYINFNLYHPRHLNKYMKT